jgi:saccharopepsin
MAVLVAMLGVAQALVAPGTGPSRFAIQLHKQRVPVQDALGFASHKNVYFGSIYVGAPQQQELAVIFDTGSGHVVLPSSNCASPACLVHRTYDPKGSQHAVEVNHDGSMAVPYKARDEVHVAYGTGEIAGAFVEDQLCLDRHVFVADGAATDGCLDLRMVAATEMSYEPFHGLPFDGLVGLGMDSLALSPEMSLFGMMVKQKKVAHPSFGVFLADSDDEISEISFGGYNPDLVRAAPVWVPVARPEEGHWQVKITRLRVDGEVLNFCEDGLCRALVDTGTSVLGVPTAIAGPLQEALERPLQGPVTPGTPRGPRLQVGAGRHLVIRVGGRRCDDCAGPRRLCPRGG